MEDRLVEARPPLPGLPCRGRLDLPRLPDLHDEAQAGVRELQAAARGALAGLPVLRDAGRADGRSRCRTFETPSTPPRRIGVAIVPLPMATERTLILIKPDAVERKLAGEILGRIEARGFERRARQAAHGRAASSAEQHYAEHAEKPFFGELVEFITSASDVGARRRGRGRDRDDAQDDRARRTRRTRSPARSAATSRCRCRTTSSTAPTRRSPPSARSRSGSLPMSSPEPEPSPSQSTARSGRGPTRECGDAPTRCRAWQEEEIGWGTWRVPRRRCRCSAELDGLDVVELGCGVAYFSAWLARRGARPAGSIRRPRSCSIGAPVPGRDRDSFPARRGVTASGCRCRTRRSISCSPSTARRSGPTLSVDPRGGAPPATERPAGVPVQQHARRSSACPIPGRSRTSCFVRSSSGMH